MALTPYHEAQRAERHVIIERGWILCNMCAERKAIKEFPVDTRTGRPSPRCTRCRYAARGRQYYEQTRGTPQKKFDTYKNMARSRGYSFTLTVVEFMSFWQKPCSYCGDAILTIGIDRLVNSAGYEIGNCVSCCETCNKMKRMQTKEEFIQRCNRIALYTLCAGAS